MFQHDIHFHVKASCYAFCNLAHALLDKQTHFLSKGTNSTIDLCGFSNNVISRSCMERTKGNYPTLDRINISTDNRLYLSNKVRSCYKGIIGFMWEGSMSTFPLESNEDFTSSSKKSACICRNITHLEIWTNMETIKFIWQPISKGTILIHQHPTSFIFFSRLEEKEQIIFRLHLNHLIQETKCCCHMHIMAASMHTTFVSRLEIKTRLLYNW